eukprot:7453564-Pyramimonas_sp.AAC.1
MGPHAWRMPFRRTVTRFVALWGVHLRHRNLGPHAWSAPFPRTLDLQWAQKGGSPKIQKYGSAHLVHAIPASPSH